MEHPLNDCYNHFLNNWYWEDATPESVKRDIEYYYRYIDLDHVANLNKYKYGQTALMYASMNTNNHKVIKTLIEHGADVNALDGYDYGITALMVACRHNENHKVIKTLIKHGADVHAEDEDGWTALMYASWYNYNPKVRKILKKHGAKKDIDKDFGCSPTAGWPSFDRYR